MKRRNINQSVATYPSTGGRRGGSRVRLPWEENAQSRHQRLFKENVEITGKGVKGSGVVFTHGEGISTPCVRHKGRQPLIKCANITSICVIFPFLHFLCLFYPFYIFFIFLWSTRGVSLTPTYSSIVVRKSDLRSSLRTKCWLNYFYPFLQDIFD